MIDLSNLKPAAGSVKNRKRIGRGQGSGRGGTSTRGHKGAQSRSGYSRTRGFEGGQMPLQRVVPKYGFNNINRVEYKAINLATLQTLADEKQITDIDLAALVSVGLVSKRAKVKILANGAVTTALTVKAHAFSQAARTAIEAAGGKTELIQSKNAQSTIDA